MCACFLFKDLLGCARRFKGRHHARVHEFHSRGCHAVHVSFIREDVVWRACVSFKRLSCCACVFHSRCCVACFGFIQEVVVLCVCLTYKRMLCGASAFYSRGCHVVQFSFIQDDIVRRMCVSFKRLSCCASFQAFAPLHLSGVSGIGDIAVFA